MKEISLRQLECCDRKSLRRCHMRSRFQSIRNVSATHLVDALMLVVSPVAARPPEAGSQAVRGATAAKPVPRLADGKPDIGGFWAHSAAGNMSRDSTNDLCSRLPDIRGCNYKGPGGPLPMTE